jgi:hypothetical protein
MPFLDLEEGVAELFDEAGGVGQEWFSGVRVFRGVGNDSSGSGSTPPDDPKPPRQKLTPDERRRRERERARQYNRRDRIKLKILRRGPVDSFWAHVEAEAKKIK